LAGETRAQRGFPSQWRPLHGVQARVVPFFMALVLGAWLALPLPAVAWTLPGRSAVRAPAGAPSPPRGLQEVAPPAAVQQLAEALASREPRITILEPRDGAVLPEGPWTLRLGVEDWPLVDAGSLGLGPHLMVQLDDGLPQPLLETTVAMPPLTPGSHRLTVTAVRPWGEVVKAPGAFRQIRLHRVAANPLALPAEGSPQLLAVSPSGAIAAEPVLLDWLLIDAPLQNLRADDARWRLRVTVNGDSFLVNQQTPLWLKGWKPGSNAVLLELVDGRGEPLNPPFNSLVREVRTDPALGRPAWLGPRLRSEDLARLLGEAPPPEAAVALEPADLPFSPAAPSQEPLAAGPAPEAGSGRSPAAIPAIPPSLQQALPRQEEGPAEPAQRPAEPLFPAAPEAERQPALPPEPVASAPVGEPAEGALVAPGAVGQAKTEPFIAPPSSAASDNLSGSDPGRNAANEADTRAAGESGDTSRIPADAAARGRATAVPSSRPRAARDEVNPDGTLIRPRPRNPLQGLREKLGR